MVHDISPEARTFLNQNLPCRPHVQMTADNIDRVRGDILKSSGEAIDWATKQTVESTESVEFAGVNCLNLCPRNGISRPDVLILYFFGGGFVTGSVEEDLPVSGSIANGVGSRVISPCYALAPENPYPKALEQATRIYTELLARKKFQHIVVVGESAGGNLALQTVCNAFESGLALPAACVLLSPWVDLTHSGDAEGFNDGRDPTLLKAWVDNAARLYAGDRDLREPALSPLFKDYPTGLPPTLITSGTRDLLLSQCVRLARILRARGNSVELRVWEDMWHVFEWYPQIPEAHQSLAEICTFISTAIEG